MSHFRSEALTFLRALRRHNRRDWFESHRERYEQHVQLPMRELVLAMDARLARIAPELTGDPRRSVFRIHRDVRFSADKSPYKTHAACWFFHAGGSSKVGREAHGGGAGLYFHLEPGASMVGGGLWMPPRPALQRIRARLLEDAAPFERIVLAPSLARRYGGLDPESALKRAPRGVPEDHEAVRWLRLQSFTLGRRLTDAQVTRRTLLATLADDFEAMRPLVRWLNDALGLPARRSR